MAVRIGDTVLLDGVERQTWSHAGMTYDEKPCVFLVPVGPTQERDGTITEEARPTLLSRLTVPGRYTVIGKQQCRKKERPQ